MVVVTESIAKCSLVPKLILRLQNFAKITILEIFLCFK